MVNLNRWTDSVGGAHLLQPDAQYQPELAVVNGVQVARLRGGTNGDTPKGSAFDASAALADLFRNKAGGTVMMLFRKSGAQTVATRALFHSSLGTAGSNGRLQIAHPTTQRLQLLTRRLDGDAQVSVQTPANSVVDGQWHIAIAEANWAAGTCRIRLDGVDYAGSYAGPGNTSDTPALRTVIGGRSQSTAAPTVTDVLAADHASLLIWDSVLSAEDFAYWEGQLANLRTTLVGA
jgi:hypothetical protein